MSKTTFFLSIVFVISGCATNIKSTLSTDENYTIQNTEILAKNFNSFIEEYNKPSILSTNSFSKNFVLERVRPISHHRELDSFSEVKKVGIKKALFGKKVKVLDIAMLKPWVLAHIEIQVKGKRVKDLALIHISDENTLKKIVHFWSKDHFEVAYNTRIKTDNKKTIKKAFDAISRGYNKKDLKAAFSVIPDFIVFEKMNPYGVRDLSLSGQKRKDFLKSKKDNTELWDSAIKKLFIVPPYSAHHVVIKKGDKILTERIIFRNYNKGKLEFTINFVGAEEHRLHILEDFYKENPLYRYDYYE